MYSLQRSSMSIVETVGNYTLEKDMMRKLFSMNTDPNQNDDDDAMS